MVHPKHRWQIFLLVTLLIPSSVFAATRTWDGGGADNNWSTAANWSDNTVPKGGDTILFDGTGKKDSTVDAAFGGSGAALQITSSNTGTITVGRALTINGNLSLSGGTFAINGGNTVTVKGSWQNGGGTLTSNTGTVVLSGSGTSYTLKETGAFKNLSLNDGLVGYWRLDDGPNTTIAADSSGNGFYGTYQNLDATNWVTDSHPPVQFDRMTYTYQNNHRSWEGQPRQDVFTTYTGFPFYITVAGWVNMTDDNPGLIFVSDNKARLYMEAYQVGGPGFSVKGAFISGGSFSVGEAAGTRVPGAWYHFAFTYDGSVARLFVDGIEVNQVANSSGISGASRTGPNWTIGDAYSGCCGGKKKMADFRIYSRALSHSEIQSLYQGNQGTGSGTYTLGSNLTVNGNLAIYSGNLDVSTSNYSVTASGSFINNARFTARSGTVTLSGITTTLKTYGTSLYNLTIAAAKSAILRTAATVTNALTINSSSSLTLNGSTLTATTATFTNAGTLTQGTGALLNRNTSISVSPSTGAVGATITVTLTDADANTNGTVANTVTVFADGETITLTETGNATGIFTGSIPTAHRARIAGNGIVERDDACTFITGVVYVDPEDSSDTATATFTLTDPEVQGCSTAGTSLPSTGGGGSRRTSGPTPIISSRSPDAYPSASPLPMSETGNPKIDARIQALSRRSVIAGDKLLSATQTERTRLEAVIKLIDFVIGRLRVRG